MSLAYHFSPDTEIAKGSKADTRSGMFPETSKYWYTFDYMGDLLYLLDIILFKSRVMFVRNGFWVKNPPEIRQHYASQPVFFVRSKRGGARAKCHILSYAVMSVPIICGTTTEEYVCT